MNLEPCPAPPNTIVMVSASIGAGHDGAARELGQFTVVLRQALHGDPRERRPAAYAQLADAAAPSAESAGRPSTVPAPIGAPV